jgi:hypothetical protein
MELLIQLFSQVDGMTGIGKTSFAISGTNIVGKAMAAFKTNGPAIIKYSPYTFAAQYLIALVSRLAGLLQKHFGFRSAHKFIYQINRTVYSLLFFKTTTGYGSGKFNSSGHR